MAELDNLQEYGKNLGKLLQDEAFLKKIFALSKQAISSGASGRDLECAQIFNSLEQAIISKKKYLHNVEVFDDSSLAELYSTFFDQRGFPPGESKVEIHLLTSMLCNIACRPCKYDCSPKEKVLGLDEVVQICEELKGFGLVRVVAEASGEPTHPKNLVLLEQLKERYGDSEDVRLVLRKIVTNGLVPARHPEVFERLHKLGTTDLGFSFYSNREIHDRLTVPGLFDLALQGLQNLDEFNRNEKKIKKWVEIILAKGVGLKDLDFYFELANVDGFQIVPLVPSGRAGRKWDELALDLGEYTAMVEILEQKRKTARMKILNLGSSFLGSGIYRRIINRKGYCNAGSGRAFVNGITGEVYACPFFAGYEGMAFGNIFTPTASISENFKSLWFDQQDKGYIRRQDFSSIKDAAPKGLCTDCRHETYCGGGCLAISYAHHLNEAVKANSEIAPMEILQKAKQQNICRFGWNKA